MKKGKKREKERPNIWFEWESKLLHRISCEIKIDSNYISYLIIKVNQHLFLFFFGGGGGKRILLRLSIRFHGRLRLFVIIFLSISSNQPIFVDINLTLRNCCSQIFVSRVKKVSLVSQLNVLTPLEYVQGVSLVLFAIMLPKMLWNGAMVKLGYRWWLAGKVSLLMNRDVIV